MAYTFKHGDRPLEGITVQRAVGRGGFGEVYYALADSGKQVALKYLRENPEIELRGIAHVMNLKSPHLITIYDVKRNAAGEPFVIMEYVSGPSLRELLVAEPGGMGVQKAAFFLKGIAGGLNYLHERGIVHRDLKPANIFYDDGYVKIGDYGLSKHMSVSKHSGQTVSVGTVHYMAPEIGSGNYTKAIDIYALGVILYEMLTGNLPFSGSSMAEILMRHLRDNPDLSGIPAPFAPVIAKALAKDPNDRYQDADEMLAAVMESVDISRSVESFDASALTQVPRSPEAGDTGRTVTAPRRPPPVPSLDVRAPHGHVYVPQELPERLQRKLEHLSRKLEQRTARLERKFGKRHGPHKALRPHGAGMRKGGRWAQVFILLAVTVGISVVLGALVPGSQDPPPAICLVLYIVGGTVGPLLTHLRLLRRLVTRNALLDRLAYASVAGLFMALGYAFAAEELGKTGLTALFFAPLAMLLICDWGRRIEEGRAGKVSGGAAFWPAVVGLIAAAIAGAEDVVPFVAAGVCAAISLMTQAAASMWPVAGGALPRGVAPRLGGPAGPPPRPAAVPEAKLPAGQSAPEDKPDHREPSPATAAEAVTPPPPVVVSAAQPSFAGRTANAGVAFLGKILLLVGLVVALGQGAFRQSAIAHRLCQEAPEIKPLVENGVPPGMVLLPLILGSLLLVIARRQSGDVHFFRGCVGCLLMLWGAVVAMVWGAEPLRMLFTGHDLSALNGPELLAPLAITGSSLIIGVFTLLWPPADRNRTIVV